MRNLRNNWYFIVLLIFALVPNENLIRSVQAVTIGNMSLIEGLRDAYSEFQLNSYILFTVFRIIPYLLLSVWLWGLSRSIFKRYTISSLAGGLAGIFGMFSWMAWGMQAHIYTEELVSSTIGLGFIFVGIYGIPVAMIGITIAIGLDRILRGPTASMQTEQAAAHKSDPRAR